MSYIDYLLVLHTKLLDLDHLSDVIQSCLFRSYSSSKCQHIGGCQSISHSETNQLSYVQICSLYYIPVHVQLFQLYNFCYIPINLLIFVVYSFLTQTFYVLFSLLQKQVLKQCEVIIQFLYILGLSVDESVASVVHVNMVHGELHIN